MDTYRNYSHTIKENDLLRVLRDAASHGCGALVIINGEYYSVEIEQKKIPSADPGELF